MKSYEEIVALVSDTLVDAGSTFRSDKKDAYRKAIATERNEKAKWVLEQILEHAEVAEKLKKVLSKDSGNFPAVRWESWAMTATG